MAYKRKSRGVGYKELSLEDRMKQWNINMADRTLNKMFNHVDKGDTLIDNRKFKPVHYTPNQLFEMANEYFYDIKEQNQNGIAIIPDIEDFCLFCNLSRHMFLKYRKSDDPEMFYVANLIANAIANCKKSLGWQGCLPEKLIELDFSNNHDYSKRLEASLGAGFESQIVHNLTDEIASRLPLNEDEIDSET